MGRKAAKGGFSDIALRLALEIWGLEELHFGWWEGLDVTPDNVHAAQRQYTEKLLSHVPEGVRSVLDVGCGTGSVALALVLRGFAVEGLAPDPELVEKARRRLGERARFHVSTFEDFETSSRYDLILMAESCQYIKSHVGLARAAELLEPGGRLLVADVFRHKAWPRDKPYISKAGHNIQRFLETAERNGFELEVNLDITDAVGPTLTLYDEFLRTKVIPVAEAGAEALRRAHPIIYRIGRWFFGSRAGHVREKYRHQDLATFREYRSYLTLRFRKGGAAE